MTDRPFAYVCSPYRGDIEANTEWAREYCRQVYEAGYIPLAPHLLFPQFLKEEIPEEREAGLEMAAALIPMCRVLVVCGDEVSEGMAGEIALAERLNIPVHDLNTFLSEHTPARENGRASVLEQIAAARVERAAAPEPLGKERPKTRGPEL